MMKVEDFPWGEFLEVRKRLVVWLRLYGNEGEPMGFDEVAKKLSCDEQGILREYSLVFGDWRVE